MAGRGQIPNPALRQYDALRVHPAIYLMEAGMSVKVGRARSALSRMRELHTALKRRGMQPGRWQVFYTADAERAELHCIHALQRVASPMPGTREFFTGITFDAALDVVRAAMPTVVSSRPLGVGLPAGLSAGGRLSFTSAAQVLHPSIAPQSDPIGIARRVENEGAKGAFGANEGAALLSTEA